MKLLSVCECTETFRHLIFPWITWFSSYSCMFKILTLRYNTNIWRNLPNAIELLSDRRWLLPYQPLIQIYYCCTGTCPAGPNSLTRVAFRSSGLQLCHIIWKVEYSIFIVFSRFHDLTFYLSKISDIYLTKATERSWLHFPTNSKNSLV